MTPTIATVGLGAAEAKTAVELLQTYGGWAMVVVLLAAVFYLFRTLNKKETEISTRYAKREQDLADRYQKERDDLGDLLEKRHEQFIQVLQDCGLTLKQVMDQNKRSEESTKAILAALEKVDRAIEACKQKHLGQ